MTKLVTGRFKIFFLIFMLLLGYIGATDADLLVRKGIQNNLYKALTLDISNRNTANEFSTSTLFNVSGMIPTGFAVESLRIKKDGEVGSSFVIYSEITSGDTDFCNQLVFTLLDEWQTQYEGILTDLSYVSEVGEESYKDFVFVASLPATATNYQSKSCQFNIHINTVTEGETGFSDAEVLENRIDASAN